MVFLIIPVLLFALYLFLTAPKIKRTVSLPKFGYAHRGLWDKGCPENSLPAFRAAVDAGYGIETDVRLTKDGIPVVFHDEDLKRMCGVNRPVSELTYEELLNFKLNGVEKIPTFAEFLETVGGQVPLLIELKGYTKDTRLCDVIAPMLDSYKGEFVVESFNPILLRKMKKLRPAIRRGQLVTNATKVGVGGSKLRNGILYLMLMNFLSRPDFIAYDKKFPKNPSLFFATKLFRAKRCIWTVKTPDEFKQFTSNGDCPIFDEFSPKEHMEKYNINFQE